MKQNSVFDHFLIFVLASNTLLFIFSLCLSFCLHPSFLSVLSRESDAAGETDVRQEEFDLRLRHRFHHQRHAHRRQSGAP